MAKTFSDVKNQIYAYLPQINQDSKATLIKNCVNLALERISRLHDWVKYRSYTPAEATLSSGDYYLSVSDFSFTRFQKVRLMYWRKTNTSYYTPIYFLDDERFIQKYGYLDYSDRSPGYPKHYTEQGGRLLFNCPATEDIIVRVFYQQYHPEVSDDTDDIEFEPEYLALQTVALFSLLELKNSLTAVEFPQELANVSTLAMEYLRELVIADKSKHLDQEEIELGTSEAEPVDTITDNFGWPV